MSVLIFCVSRNSRRRQKLGENNFNNSFLCSLETSFILDQYYCCVVQELKERRIFFAVELLRDYEKNIRRTMFPALKDLKD